MPPIVRPMTPFSCGPDLSGLDVLAFPNVNVGSLESILPELKHLDGEVRDQVERDAIYVNYISRQDAQAIALKRDESVLIPQGFEFDSIAGLSNELKHKLSVSQPANVAQAGRIEGMTPAGLALIVSRLRRVGKVLKA